MVIRRMRVRSSGATTLSVPPQHRFGLYDEERGSPAAEPPTRQNPETPVRFLKARPWRAALQDRQLLPEAKVIRDQQHPWPHRGSKGPKQPAKHSRLPSVVARAGG